VPFLFFAAIALIGAGIHAHRERHKGAARMLEIFLVWWMVVAVGVAAIFGSIFHLFDGPSTAASRPRSGSPTWRSASSASSASASATAFSSPP